MTSTVSPGPSVASFWTPRTRELALTLTRWPSVTGSEGEAAFAGRLLSLVRDWPYFQAHPSHLWSAPVPGTAACNGYLLVKGSGPQTVVLSGHYDTVSTEHYGDLQAVAHEPEELKTRLIAALQRGALNAAEASALADLSSGDFLPGRGLLDMKGGIAAGLAVLERYSTLPEAQRPGNLLLIVSPDEEVLSKGARRAAQELPELARRHHLRPHLGINLDATNDAGQGEEGQVAYLGTVGKLLLTALVVGRPTHASYPFDGTSAALLASELLQEIEGNPQLTDEAHGETAPAPVCLEFRALRAGYDVTTPAHFWATFNVLTYRRSPQQVLEQFRQVAAAAGQQALTVFAQRAAQAHSAAAPGLQGQRCDVLTFAELRARAAERVGEEQILALIQELSSDPDPLNVQQRVTHQLVQWAAVEGPAVVLGFGSVHYPHSHVSGKAPAVGAWVAEQLAQVSSTAGAALKCRPYFAGISDMSFLGQALPDQPLIRAQTPDPQRTDTVLDDAMMFPVINVGPWGRDYHQKFERIYQPYAFGVLPQVIWHLTRASFAAFPTAQDTISPDGTIASG